MVYNIEIFCEIKFLLGTKFPLSGHHKLRKIQFSNLQYSKEYILYFFNAVIVYLVTESPGLEKSEKNKSGILEFKLDAVDNLNYSYKEGNYEI